MRLNSSNRPLPKLPGIDDISAPPFDMACHGQLSVLLHEDGGGFFKGRPERLPNHNAA
jgi:hypothetical protein